MNDVSKHERLSEIARALAHPVRLYILSFLKNQSCCYTGKLTEQLPYSQATISQHLKILKDVGLIKGELETPRIKYCLDEQKWQEANKLLSQFFKHQRKIP